jgi:septal ring factor EnvC (AmiA/AmiB activator)
MRAYLLAIAVAFAATQAAAEDASLERMAALEAQIREGRSRLEDTRSKARELTQLLSASEARRAELGAAIRQTEAEVKRLRRESAELEREIAKLDRDLGRRRGETRQSAAILLSLQQGGGLEVLLAGEDHERQAMRSGTLRVTMMGLRERIRSLDEDLRRLGEQRSRLESNITRQQAARAKLAGEQKEAAARAEQQKRTLSLVRQDEAMARDMVDELEGARAELARLIARSERGDTTLLPFAPLKGSLEPPARGDLLLGFGRQRDPVFKVDIDHPGWTMRVRKGTPAKAVAAGEVAYAGWLRGYGNLVVLRHGDEYFTLYGHLDEILVKPGEGVREAVPVGLTGDSGSMYGPALHFEIRHRRDAVDPQAWMAKKR